MGKNNWEKAFYYSGLVFDVKDQLLHKLLPTKKNHKQLKCEKKIMLPKNCLPPLKNGQVRPLKD